MARLLPLVLYLMALSAPAGAMDMDSALVIPGVSSGGAVQSYLRFSNSDGIAHNVSVMLHLPGTGEMLATWTSPSVAAGGTYEVPVADMLAGADPSIKIALPPTLVIAVSGFVGHVQHATWTQASGAWSNISTCGMALMADPLSLPYVSGPARTTLAGFVRVTNATSSARSLLLDFMENNGRSHKWASPAVPSMGSITTSISDIARLATPPIGNDVKSMMVMSDAAPFGINLSYVEGAAGGSSFDDFSAACMLAIASPVTHDSGTTAPATPGGSHMNMDGMTMQ